MKNATQRRILQIVIGTLSVAPLLSGIIGLAGIRNPFFLENLPVNFFLDSNLRFLNGMCVAIALSFYFIIPIIEKETFACRILCCSMFMGGLGRLISIFDLGKPPLPLIAFLILELTTPIVIVLWQHRISIAASK